jgi:hypothetical protein
MRSGLKPPRDTHSATLRAEFFDGRSLEGRGGGAWMRPRTPEVQPAVRAATVVVLGIVPKDCLQMARSDDQDPIEALGLDRLHPTLCEGVGARCCDRGSNDIDASSSEDLIEATAVLGIAVVDEESHGRASILEAHREVAPLLSDPHRVGAGGAAGDMDTPARELDEEST